MITERSSYSSMKSIVSINCSKTRFCRHVEKGSIVLIGATTENPFHDVNPAIRSRCGEILQLNRLDPEDLVELLERALHDEARGLGKIED